ncbi:MAG: T9SS type A sorting domain-containing protein [Chitinophagales bacterium]
MSKIKRYLGFALFLTSLFVSETTFSQATYDMALGYRRPFNSDWIGYNGSNMIRDSIGWNNPKLIGNLPKLHPMNLRYPAGGTSNWWNWRTGWFVNRPDLPTGFAGLTPKYSKLEVFKKSLDTTHANAMLEVNMLTSTLQEQLAMLKHADSIGIQVKYVELGSEFYLDGGEDSALIVVVYPTAADYAAAASIWADSIHYYFPAAKVCAQGAFNRNNAARRIIWDEGMFPTLHGEDAISYHAYMSVDDYADTAAISSLFLPSDVPVMMARPFKMWDILSTQDFPLIPAGKEIWITEYNMRDHTKPLMGCWGQALFVATQSMQFLNDTRIKHLACHAMCGSGVAGAYFNTIRGFNFGGDGNFASIPNAPASTQYWGLTSTGRAMQQLGVTVKKGTYASPLEFKYIPTLTAFDGLVTLKFPALYGWAIISNDSTQALIVNLSPNDVNIRTNYIFPSGGTYSCDYTDPMVFVAQNSDVTHTNITTLPATLLIKAYSITRISGTTIPAAPPVATIIPLDITAFCLGDSVVLDAGAGFVEYRWSTGDSTRTITARADADYWVHARTVTNGYWGGDTMHITVYQPPAIPLMNNMPTHSFCHGDSLVATVKFPNPALTYTWSNGSTGTSSAIKAGGSYTITATNSYGCYTTSLPVAFTEYQLPTPVISAASPAEFCSGGNVILTSTTVYNSYSWTGGYVGQTHTYSASGTYSCTVTDANSCVGTSNSISVNVHTLPIPDINTNTGATTFCSNAGVYLTTSITGYTYNWQQGGTNISGATNQTYTPTAGGQYRIKITDGLGCTARSNSLTITLNNPPTPNITGSISICPGSSATWGTSASYNSYSWSGGATTATIPVTTAGTYTVTVTDANGCSGSSSKTMTINSLPAPAITAAGATEFCSGSNVALSVSTVYNSYSWTGGYVGQSHTYSATGTYSCTVTDANGCTGTSNTISVNVHTIPVPGIQTNTGDTTFCAASGIYLTTSTTGYNYQWQKGGTNVTGATNQNYTPTVSSNYRVEISDNLGCTARSASLSLTLNTAPTPSITGNTSICTGSSTTLGTVVNYSSYLWSTGATSSTIPVTIADTYTVTVTGSNGCTGSSSKTLVINSPPAPVIVSSNGTSFCTGGTTTLSTSAPYSSYSWSNSKVTSTIDVTSTGTFTVTVTDANGCSGSSAPLTISVGSLAVPVVTSSTGSGTFCTNIGAYLTTDAGYSYQWLKGSTILTGATNKNYTPVTGGGYKVQIADNSGCTKKSVNFSVTLYTPPSPTITGALTVCEGTSTTLSANTTYTTYSWSTGATAQSIPVSTGGTYTLTVTNTNGCTGTATATTTFYSLPVSVITASGATDFCDGGTVDLTATAASSYLWSHGKTAQTVTIKSSGTYTVTVTDSHGCTKISSPSTVNEWVIPEVIVTAVGPTTYCKYAEGSYLTTIAGTGYGYQWKKGTVAQTGATNQTYQPTATGTYKVTITESHGCTKASGTGVAVTVNKLPTASISNAGSSNLCGIATATLKEVTGSGNTYQWRVDGTDISGAVGSQYTTGVGGSYNCFVTSSPGCTALSNQLVLTNNCRIEDGQSAENALPSSMKLYPNPATNGIHIEGYFASQEDGIAEIEIYNMLGQIVYREQQDIAGGKLYSDLIFDERFGSGNYLTRISLNGDMIKQSFIITGIEK